MEDLPTPGCSCGCGAANLYLFIVDSARTFRTHAPDRPLRITGPTITADSRSLFLDVIPWIPVVGVSEICQSI